MFGFLGVAVEIEMVAEIVAIVRWVIETGNFIAEVNWNVNEVRMRWCESLLLFGKLGRLVQWCESSPEIDTDNDGMCSGRRILRSLRNR